MKEPVNKSEGLCHPSQSSVLNRENLWVCPNYNRVCVCVCVCVAPFFSCLSYALYWLFMYFFQGEIFACDSLQNINIMASRHQHFLVSVVMVTSLSFTVTDTSLTNPQLME